MKKNRRTRDVLNLASGPGKLTEAMNITGKQNGLDLTRSKRLFICKPEEKEKFEVVSTKRIGIRVGVDKHWRFYVKNNNFVLKS